MTIYEVARSGDEEEILDFANLVFSQAHRPHDFRALLPKVYARSEFADYHVVARQNGRICAMVGVWPMAFRVMEGLHLNLGYVGTVSVHPYHRGEGHMQKLVPMAVERSREAGMDLMSLGGQRQRYRYFGFEQGGLKVDFAVTATNLKHDLAQANTEDIAFTPLSDDDGTMNQARAMHAKECLTGVRSADMFQAALTSWGGKGLAVRRDGVFLGYLYAADNSIGEWVLSDHALIGTVLKAYMQQYKAESLRISVPAHEADRIRALDAFAEDSSLNDAGMYRVLNWPKVISQLMTLKKELAGLNEGMGDLCIEGEGTFRITVDGEGVHVTETEPSQTTSITRTQAVGLLFSLTNRLGRGEDAWHDWFPLPLSVPQADCF